MTLMQRRRALMGAVKKARLPAEYQEVEYIGFNNSPILTPILSFRPQKITATVSFAQNNKDEKCLGAYGYGGVATYNTFYRLVSGSSSLKLTSVPVSTEKTALFFETTTGSLMLEAATNNVTYSDSYSNAGTNRGTYVTIGGLHSTGTTILSGFVGRFYGHIFVYSGTELLGEFIPCYKKIEGTIGYYDVVSRAFITSSTGTLTKGADV